MATLRVRSLLASVAVAIVALASAPAAQRPSVFGSAPAHAKAVDRLLIKNAMVIYGNAKPAFGPVDILIDHGLIAAVGPEAGRAGGAADAVIDATGKYVMPALVDTHVHLRGDDRDGASWPDVAYEFNLYLSAGVTTVRDVGSDFAQATKWRADSAAHKIAAPRIQIYSRLWNSKGNTPEKLREGVRYAKEQGSDGLKLGGMDRDQLEAVLDEAHKQGLPTTVHIGVDETTGKDYAELGVGSIEHFYGIGDAALEGIQDFPADHNANNETHRFARAGELYTQRNFSNKKLSAQLDLMIRNNVAWSPTLSVYEAQRDLIRSQNVPWFNEYLHPAIRAFWQPNLKNHGSFFFGWTATQEGRWARDYRVWMDALREFGVKGGQIVTGDDAGVLWNLYGFGLIRELELQEEAGFHALEVLRHATANGAALLGLGDRLGRVRVGFSADVLVVNGNPLENLRVLNPYGTDVAMLNGKPVSNMAAISPTETALRNERGGGIEWTIKNGIPYHVPTLMNEVKQMVAKARTERARPTSPQP